MPMPRLNFLDIRGSSFKCCFRAVSNLKLNLKSKIEGKVLLESSTFNLRFEVEFQIRLFFETFETATPDVQEI